MIRKNEVNINQFKEKPNLLKKIELTNSVFAFYDAKNVRITDNKSKSIVFCIFMTRSTMLFSIGTASVFMLQIFFNLLCEKNFYSKI